MSSLPHPAGLPPQARTAMPAALGFVLLALLLAVIGLAFRDTLQAMLQVWNTENFQHGYLIVPMALWMIWRNREALRRQPLVPFWPAALLLAGACALWLAGRLAGVNVVEQFAIIGMIPCALALVFGWRVVCAIAFPLAFLVFAVPFGEGLYPVMMERTAEFTVAAVRLSGVPVIREGLFFELPSGRWSVVEACSGLRYLLAALPLASLYAYISWSSWLTRALFIGMTVVVAVVANWLRAYLIVMMGHLSGMKIAVGVDHLIYGWVFFGIVMGLVFWIGSLWRGPAPSALAGGGSLPAGPASSPVSAHLLAFVVGAAVLAGTAAGAVRLMDQGEATVRIQAFEPLLAPMTAPLPAGVYQPSYGGGVAGLSGWIGEEAPVGLRLVQYVQQHRHGEMITYENGVNPGRADSGQHWRVSARAGVDPRPLGAAFPAGTVNEYQIAGPTGRYLAWEWFWVNGRVLAEPTRVKLFTAYDLLRGQGDESLAWVLWTPIDGPVEAARDRLVKASNRLQSRVQAAGL